MPIPCPHFKITIVKRSQGQSAVAGAAYQSGERLFSEYDQKTKFYNKKKELVRAEIVLPSHAPPGFADRATLWNAVEAVKPPRAFWKPDEQKGTRPDTLGSVTVWSTPLRVHISIGKTDDTSFSGWFCGAIRFFLLESRFSCFLLTMPL